MSSAPPIDEKTAATIRDALVAAGSGRLADACRIGERGLAAGGDPAALNAMLGAFHCRAGNVSDGLRHLRAAHANRPGDPVIASNLAAALAQVGEYRELLDAIPENLGPADRSMRLERLRGFAAQNVDDFATAISCYERVVAAFPDDWESWNNLGNARRLAGDLEGAVAALARAVAISPETAPVRLNYATVLAFAGQVAEAEAELGNMARDFPRDPTPLRELHALLKEQGRDEEALEPIEQAVERSPTDTELLLALASHRMLLLKTADAEDAYQQVIALDPPNPLANLGLAVAFEITNRASELATLVPAAEQRGVGPEVLHFIRAYDLRRKNRFENALAELDHVPEEIEVARRYQLLGQLNDAIGNYEEAFRAFCRMNELQADQPFRPADRGAQYRTHTREQLEAIGAGCMGDWREEADREERSTPVFLVGFPRSGTTLLDTMLMGHPDVEVLEEEPALANASACLPPFAGIPSASDDQIRAARDEYFRTAAAAAALAPGKLIVDKNPLSMNALIVIRRLFPDARVILALRHPCDVVLSCYITNFRLNSGMASFLELETAAELYDLSFRLFEETSSLTKLPVHRVSYEDVVHDRARELKSLIDFLGLEWRGEVLNHEATAASRGRIKTASYAQVVQPIYRSSAGRWQHYRKHLEPVVPVLEPWATKFGYAV